MAYSSQLLADPAGSSTLVTAVQWLQGTLLGTVATTIAIIAVATTGMMMFSGRLDIRRGIRVVLGCFMLFGASTIVAGIRAAADGSYQPNAAAATIPITPQQAPATTPSPLPYDPYAGAAVPDG